MERVKEEIRDVLPGGRWPRGFAGDIRYALRMMRRAPGLVELLPEDTIAIGPSDENWPNRDAILESSRQFAAGGGKLIRLEFPKTEIRAYGRTAIIYTTYLFETKSRDGQRNTSSGRATEMFVLRKGKWLNPGWHMDSGK